MEIRKFEDGDEHDIRTLFELSFGKKLNEKEWLWKYRLSPWGSSSTVALHDGLIIAHYGGVKLPFCEGQTEYMAYQICDVMTHPDFRAMFLARRGAMVRTAELFESSIPMDFAFGFPSERHARLATIQLGVERNRHVRMLVKPVPEIPKRRRPLLGVTYGWDNIKAREIDSLWTEIMPDFSLTINKTSSYIFWRYRDGPSRNYDLVTFRSQLTGKLKGFAVLAFSENEVQVLDFFAQKGFNLESLFGGIEEAARLRKAERVKLWMNPNEMMFLNFKNLGYSEEQGIPITCKILNKSISLTAEAFFDTYCYRMGDYDAS